MSEVNRTFSDQMIDDIDHALGRPKDPDNPYRNYYATGNKDQIAKFLASGYWDQGRTYRRMTWMHVNDEGVKALKFALTEGGA